jgi:ACS family hexuronate transporter-like MFS transporter
MAIRYTGVDATPVREITSGRMFPRKTLGHVRWWICALLFVALSLNYIDRQVLGILKPTLQARYGWSEVDYGNIVFWFQAAYGIFYVVFGRLAEKFGARVSYALAAGVWTVSHIAHALASTALTFILVRIPLAIGEAGAFPSQIHAVAEWFPQKERAFAIGIINSGSNIGAIVAMLIVPAVTLTFNWQMAFIFTGLLTVVWLVCWLVYYRSPDRHPRLSADEAAYIQADDVAIPKPAPFGALLRIRETWGYICARFCIDGIWYTFLSWLPDFFGKVYHLNLKSFGIPLVAVYVCADVGSAMGGWTSSRLLENGFTPNKARKLTMLGCALLVVPVAFAVDVSNLWLAVLLIGLATAGHQGFSANMFSYPSDLFPRGAASTVVGLGGLAGAVGGMAMAQYSGWMLQELGSYRPIFIVGSLAYLVALAFVQFFTPAYRPVSIALVQNSFQ